MEPVPLRQDGRFQMALLFLSVVSISVQQLCSCIKKHNTNAVAYAPTESSNCSCSVFPHNTNLTKNVGPAIARDIINLCNQHHPMHLERKPCHPTPIAKLIDSSKLPGIGIKTATRLAFYTIGMSDDDVNEFAKNLLAAKRELTYCSICGRLTDDDPFFLFYLYRS